MECKCCGFNSSKHLGFGQLNSIIFLLSCAATWLDIQLAQNGWLHVPLPLTISFSGTKSKHIPQKDFDDCREPVSVSMAAAASFPFFCCLNSSQLIPPCHGILHCAQNSLWHEGHSTLVTTSSPSFTKNSWMDNK